MGKPSGAGLLFLIKKNNGYETLAASPFNQGGRSDQKNSGQSGNLFYSRRRGRRTDIILYYFQINIM